MNRKEIPGHIGSYRVIRQVFSPPHTRGYLVEENGQVFVLLSPDVCWEVNRPTVQRIMKYASRWQQLDSPYIQKLYDLHIIEKRPWLKLEHLPGDYRNYRLLGDYLFGSKLTDEELADRALGYARGLHAIYSSGVKRTGGITPRSLLLYDRGQPVIPLPGLMPLLETHWKTCLGWGSVNDFIAAEEYEPWYHPAWLAPEQFSDWQLSSRLSDIYSFGMVLLHLTGGRGPRDEALPGNGSQDHWHWVHEFHTFEVPPSPLKNVIEGCLAKNPADRIQSTGELLSLLEPTGAGNRGVTVPHETREPFTRALYFFHERSLDKSSRALDEAARKGYPADSVFLYRGLLHIYRERPGDALAHFRSPESENYTFNADITYHTAFLLYSLVSPDDSEAYMDNAILLGVLDPRLFALRGRLYLARNRLKKAGEMFRRALDLDAENREALKGLMIVAEKSGDDREQVRLIKRIQRYPDAGMEGHLSLARFFQEKKQYEDALTLLLICYRHDSAPEIVRMILQCYGDMGDPRGLLHFYGSLEEKRAEYLPLAAGAHEQIQEYDSAFELLLEYVRDHRQEKNLIVKLGQLALMTGKHDLVKECFGEPEDDPELTRVAVRIMVRCRDLDKAEKCVRSLVRMVNLDVKTALLYLDALHPKAKQDQKLRALELTRGMEKKEPFIYHRQGQLYESLGDLNAAAERYRSFLNHRPDHALTWLFLARIEEKQHRQWHARDAYRSFLACARDSYEDYLEHLPSMPPRVEMNSKLTSGAFALSVFALTLAEQDKAIATMVHLLNAVLYFCLDPSLIPGYDDHTFDRATLHELEEVSRLFPREELNLAAAMTEKQRKDPKDDTDLRYLFTYAEEDTGKPVITAFDLVIAMMVHPDRDLKDITRSLPRYFNRVMETCASRQSEEAPFSARTHRILMEYRHEELNMQIISENRVTYQDTRYLGKEELRDMERIMTNITFALNSAIASGSGTEEPYGALTRYLESALLPTGSSLLRDMELGPMATLEVNSRLTPFPWEAVARELFPSVQALCRTLPVERKGPSTSRQAKNGTCIIFGSDRDVPDMEEFRNMVNRTLIPALREENRDMVLDVLTAGSPQEIVARLSRHSYDMVIYHGHHVYSRDSSSTGWLCRDDRLFTLEHLAGLDEQVPHVIIANACETARHEGEFNRFFAVQALSRGCRAYIGSHWLLEYKRSETFLLEFLHQRFRLLRPLRDAYRLSLNELARVYGEDDYSLSGYVYYES